MVLFFGEKGNTVGCVPFDIEYEGHIEFYCEGIVDTGPSSTKSHRGGQCTESRQRYAGHRHYRGYEIDVSKITERKIHSRAVSTDTILAFSCLWMQICLEESIPKILGVDHFLTVQ